MNAGVSRVIASQWAVRDGVTRDLMTSLYRKVWQEGASPSAALRESQLELWRQGLAPLPLGRVFLPRGVALMSEVAWAELLKTFDEDPRKAAERLQGLIDKLVRIFEWRGCRESGEAAFEVINRVANKVHQGVELTTSIERYAGGFVTPIFHEYLRRQEERAGDAPMSCPRLWNPRKPMGSRKAI